MIGFAGLAWIALAPVLARLARRSIVGTTAVTAASVWTADLAALGVKVLVERPRPYRTVPEADPLLRGELASSFPSGHAATSFAGALVLAYTLRRWIPWLVALALLIAWSRVYVGVHYPLDVAGGAVLGAAVGLAFLTAVRARRPTSGDRPRSRGAPPAG